MAYIGEAYSPTSCDRDLMFLCTLGCFSPSFLNVMSFLLRVTIFEFIVFVFSGFFYSGSCWLLSLRFLWKVEWPMLDLVLLSLCRHFIMLLKGLLRSCCRCDDLPICLTFVLGLPEGQLLSGLVSYRELRIEIFI